MRSHKSGTAMEVQAVGVVGCGTMGAGIAVCAARAKLKVVVLEQNPKALAAGRQRIASVINGWVAKKRISAEAAQQLLQLISFTLDYDQFSNVDLVVEAAFENMDIKKDVFQKLDRHTPPHALLCSNTSTLDIDELALSTSRPSKV